MSIPGTKSYDGKNPENWVGNRIGALAKASANTGSCELIAWPQHFEPMPAPSLIIARLRNFYMGAQVEFIADVMVGMGKADHLLFAQGGETLLKAIGTQQYTGWWGMAEPYSPKENYVCAVNARMKDTAPNADWKKLASYEGQGRLHDNGYFLTIAYFDQQVNQRNHGEAKKAEVDLIILTNNFPK